MGSFFDFSRCSSVFLVPFLFGYIFIISRCIIEALRVYVFISSLEASIGYILILEQIVVYCYFLLGLLEILGL